MTELEQLFLAMVWSLWALYWMISAWDVKRTMRHESLLSRLGHLGPLAVTGLLLAPRQPPWGWLAANIFTSNPLTSGAGLAMVVGGLSFCVWARRALGRNWSGIVTVKEGHELVREGPYRMVRHPIYTGLVLAFVGMALVSAQWRGVLAVAIGVGAFWRKLRLEERWMTEIFGQRYVDYREHTKALIPGLL